MEKSFYDVQRFAEEEGVLRCAMHRTPKTFAGSEERLASRGKEHSPPSVVKPTTDCTADFGRRHISIVVLCARHPFSPEAVRAAAFN